MKRLLSHIGFILSGMLMVLLLIDRVNSSMRFIDNRITKWLLIVLCAVGLVNGVIGIVETARSRARRIAKARKEELRRQKSGD